MSKAPSPLRRAIAPLVTLLVLLVVFAPMLLFGESFGALGLIFVAAGILGGGLFLSRAGGGANVRTIGKLLAVVGLVLLVAALVLLVLVLGGLGRPF